MGRAVVKKDDPEQVEELLRVLRRNGVAKYNRSADGSLSVELYPVASHPEAPSVYPPPLAETEPLYPLPEAPSEEEEAEESIPRQTGGHRPVFAGLKVDDPLFDHVKEGQ